MNLYSYLYIKRSDMVCALTRGSHIFLPPTHELYSFTQKLHNFHYEFTSEPFLICWCTVCSSLMKVYAMYTLKRNALECVRYVFVRNRTRRKTTFAL